MAIIMKDKGCTASTIGFWLVIVGAVNWGLVGLGGFFGGSWNIVNMVVGWAPMWVENLVYVLVGVAGVMTAIGCTCKTCTACRADMGEAPKA